MATLDRREGLDHVVVLMFENRSFDNLLGRFYEPGEVASFEGVLGKELSNPIPGGPSMVLTVRSSRTGRREHEHAVPGPGRGVSARQHPVVRPSTREQPLAAGRADDLPVQRAARSGRADDGRFRHRLHQRLHRGDGSPADLRGVRPDHDWLHARADAGAVHARSRLRGVRPLVLEVPSQTFTNRSFFHSATSSGMLVNAPSGPSRSTTPRRRSSIASNRTG